MKEIVINTENRKSVIRCGRGVFEKCAPELLSRQLYIVTDSNVFALYGELLKKTFGSDRRIYVLQAGESSKTFENLGKILRDMLDSGMNRSCTVIAFGGGVVGDIAGLASSLYMRGTRLLQIPTTLLSQVDSSVGGKTAVDMGNVKNAVGSFYQPEEVLIDPMFLSTLPEREMRCGLGEIVKYGALDKNILEKIEKSDNLFSESFFESIVVDCIEHKAAVVKADERDVGGVRKTLNLGHTTGHAMELFYGDMSHGEYVLAGMYYELYIAVKLGICADEYAERLRKTIKKIIGIPAPNDIERAAEIAVYDKKNAGGKIVVVAPAAEGSSAEIELAPAEYKKLLKECRESLENA